MSELSDIIDSIESYAKRVAGGTEKKIIVLADETIAFLTPLGQQIEATALALGKQDLAAGLQVLKDSVATAVQAGATAIAAGQSPVAAAEASFLTTAAGEGKVALSNAESGAIKAGVALVQQAVAPLASPAVTEPETATPGA